jgi:hypothetical protein
MAVRKSQTSITHWHLAFKKPAAGGSIFSEGRQKNGSGWPMQGKPNVS